MSGGIIDRIKNWNSTKPNEIMQAFASDLHEIVERMEIAELSVAERDTLLAVVAAQARQIEAARDAIGYACETWPKRDDDYYRPDHENAMEGLRDWLTVYPQKGDTE